MAAVMNDAAVFVETDGPIATVFLNQPERLNAWSTAISGALLETLRELEQDDSVRGVILTGQGRAFCAGADLKNPNTHHVDDVEAAIDDKINAPSYSPHFDLVSHYRKPIVAAVNGWAVGIGCLLPLCCDFIYASESAKFRLPQVPLGVLPAYGGGLRLARAVGSLNAAEMILTGRTVEAEEAARWGIASAVLPDAELLPYTQQQMQLIAGHPPAAVFYARESLRTSIESNDMRSAEVSDIHRFMLLSARRDTRGRHEAWRDRRSQ